MAACSIVVTEAGGQFTDLDGRPGPLGDGAYATNGRLHDALLSHLSGGGAEAESEPAVATIP
jgi:histidinol-phosphatase